MHQELNPNTGLVWRMRTCARTSGVEPLYQFGVKKENWLCNASGTKSQYWFSMKKENSLCKNSGAEPLYQFSVKKNNSLCNASGTKSPNWLGVHWEDRLMGRPRCCWNDGIVSPPLWLVEPLIMLWRKQKKTMYDHALPVGTWRGHFTVSTIP